MVSRILFCVVLLLTAITLPAKEIILSDSSGRKDVLGAVEYIRDEAGTLTLDEVRQAAFQPVAGVPNFGFDKSVYWFRVEIKNLSHTTHWLLEIPFAPLDNVSLYEWNASGNWTERKSGDHIAISEKEIEHRHALFNIRISQGTSKIIYLKVATNSSVQLPISLWTSDAFVEASFHIQMINGLFYGAMLLMALYQLFLFFSIRDRITFYYVVVLVAMCNVVALFQGYTFLYMYPSWPKANDIMAMFAGPLFLLFSTLLTRAFLNLKQFSVWLDRLLLLNMILDILAGFAMLILYQRITYGAHHYFVLTHCTLVLIAAGYCFFKNYKPARYYLLAWITLLLATLIFSMSNLGLMPGYLSTNYSGLMIGCILQMLFISFALGDRWNELIKETERAKELELQLREQEKARLEQEVKIRMAEIQSKSERLEEVNRVKDKLFSLVSHDIKGPLGSLRLALAMMKTGQVSPEEFQHLTSALEARFGQTTEFVENLLQWATLQLKGERFEPSMIDLSIVSTEALDLLELDIKRKNITIRNMVPSPYLAFADPNMVRSVLRNLLTNAVKFTGARGTISLNCWKHGGQVIISVADTGVGIPLANRRNLFTLDSITTAGTKLEKGTGLGLMLCREFVEKNGGRIWFDSEEGKGTTFYFSLPEEGQCELPSASLA
jgi:two-component system, sensor histidine kinase LadS